MKHPLTKKFVEKLLPPSEGNRIYYDSEIKGFGVRITANNARSFILNYRVNGRERRYTIGEYPVESVESARAKAITLKNDVNNGIDPLGLREQNRIAPTVEDLARDYMERYAMVHKRPTSIRNDREMLEKIILPRLMKIQVQAVTRRDVEALHQSLKSTPYRANRVLALLSKMFGLAVEWQWRPDNPVKGVPRFPEDKRERWLDAKEIGHLVAALDEYPDQTAANAIRLILLTGSREGEVLSASWEQFDLQRGVWTKPSHHTKQKRIEHVPLNQAALAVLRKMQRESRHTYLFPGESEEKETARVTIRRPWVQVCKAAGLATAEQVKGKRKMLIRYRPALRIHDLRHTFASHLVSSGMSLHIVGKLLGHTLPQTTARYAHLADKPLREATNKFGQMLKAAAAKSK